MLGLSSGTWKSLTLFLFLLYQELEEQLREEENKVNGLNKAKAKLERDLDEVGAFSKILYIVVSAM